MKYLLPIMFLAISAGLQVVGFYVYCNMPINWYAVISGFGITFGTYALNRAIDKEDIVNTPKRYTYFHRWRALWSIVLVGSIIIAPQQIKIAVLIIGVLTCAYTFWLKRICIIKTFLTVIVWSTAAIIMIKPIITPDIVFLFLAMCVGHINSAVRSDMRDVQGDMASGVKTIPVLIGNSLTGGLLFVISFSFLYASTFLVCTGKVDLPAFGIGCVGVMWSLLCSAIDEDARGVLQEILIDSHVLVTSLLLIIVGRFV